MPASDDFKYWAFISYSHADRAWAEWLHHALETYRVPSRLVGSEDRVDKIPSRLIPVFRDRDELATSTDLGDRLRNALAHSRFLLVICSPDAAASRWVNEEIRCFQVLGRSDRVLPLIVAGEPSAATSGLGQSPAADCFPSALRFQVDGSGELTALPAVPIAADVRPGNDPRRHALLKLAAGMLGVEYDVLRQRERQRERQRLIVRLTAIAVVATAFAGVWRLHLNREAVLRNHAAHVLAMRQADGHLLVCPLDRGSR